MEAQAWQREPNPFLRREPTHFEEAFPPQVGLGGQGIFGNHSFAEDYPSQRAGYGQLEDWSYDPYRFCEKPLMKVQPVNFDGTPRTVPFEEFKATFEVLVGQRNMPETQKVICLKQCLLGEPKKIVQSTIGTGISPGSLLRALYALENHYGGPQRMVMYYIHKLNDYPSVKRFDAVSLLDLIVVVDEIYHRYQDHNPRFLEYDEMMAAHVRRIIPLEERDRYYHELARAGRRDTFLTIRDYLKSRYEALRLASIADSQVGTRHSSHHCAESEETQSQEEPPQSVQHMQIPQEDLEVLLASQEAQKEMMKPKQPATATPNKANERQFVCSFCQKDHPLWRCEEFRVCDVPRRFQHIREKRLCFHCLLGGHRIQDCKYRPDQSCGVDDCQAKHHRLLHNYKSSGLCSIELFLAEDFGTEVVQYASHPQREIAELREERHELYKAYEDEEYISIKTATVELLHGNTRKRVIVALDSCSNSTNIDADLARELGLEVCQSGIIREINFLERTARVESDIVKFALSPLNGSAVFEVKGFTVRDLIKDSPVVNWNKAADLYPHLRKADIPTPQPGDRVQILLGSDQADLMTPYRVLRGPRGAPVAELTDLG